MPSILLVEDDITQRMLLASLLKNSLQYNILEAANGREAVICVKNNHDLELVVMDIMMPEMGGLDALKVINRQYPDLPVIMLTASNDANDAVQAMKQGAYDFLFKPVNPVQFITTVKNSLKAAILQKQLSEFKRRELNTTKFSDIIGFDKGLAATVARAERAAATDIPVRIYGESGVGKELFARAIHGESKRSGQPFVAINCGALPASLAESTLFGHVKGAFTGATSDSSGKFREADGGTIFLDEVGELPPDIQVKLLRVLQQKELEPVGSAKSYPVNVRIISATNRNLVDDVNSGKFREDLFFRLDVLPLHVPSLREHNADIPILIQYFVESFIASENLGEKKISDDAVKWLCNYSWPGNIRQLHNVIRRAMVYASGDTVEDYDFMYLDKEVRSNVTKPDNKASIPPNHIALFHDDGRQKTIQEIEQDVISATLSYHNNNITNTAQALGIPKSTFYRWMKN